MNSRSNKGIYVNTIQDLLTNKVRAFLYLSSFANILFAQNYCINVCPFINGLNPMDLTFNLSIIFVFQLLVREFLFKRFNAPKEGISLPRQAYYLSMISWVLAGIAAFLLHTFKYPHFPLSSHAKILSGYWVLGAGVLAQLEYIVFEKRYKTINKARPHELFSERISRRILESFFIFTLAPTFTLMMIVTRYYSEGMVELHVTFEVLYVGLLFVMIALAIAYMYGRMLHDDTKTILRSVAEVKEGHYAQTYPIIRPDELGEISSAIGTMSSSIEQGIHTIEALNQEITATQKEVVYTMGTIAEFRSKETGNHVKRVAEYSKLLALKYGLSPQEAELLKLASPMHDIGKVAISDGILNKPGKLTPEEFAVMKTHATMGYDMLKYSHREILQAAAIVAHEHHEKYDGSGYPRGLKGDEIHIYGRITAVADVFDALGSDRVYKKAWEDERIFTLFNEEKGKHFDPKLIHLFFENLDEINRIRAQYKE